jgi:formate hydrogenlyase subunit 6/NADH:ubiquinone oxidoreductase subunit I
MLKAVQTVLKQFFTKKSVNKFPSKRMPKSIVDFLAKGKIHPPVEVPEGFRGKIKYYYDKCIGCALCHKVCPADVIELYKVEIDGKKKNRIVLRMGKCTYCEECVKICPTDALEMEPVFMTANFEKYGDDQVIGIEERKKNEIQA